MLRLDPAARTPAHRHNDGLDYVPTDKYVLFGHHFAAIAGAGPLVGPVLAAQMGYLPGTLWLLAGVVFAGAVQDFLSCSSRRGATGVRSAISSRPRWASAPGVIAMVGILTIMIILLAVLALVVVKALADSPWGAFTVFATLPIAVFMGVYGRYLAARAHRRDVGDRLRSAASPSIALRPHVSPRARRSRRCSPSRARRSPSC